MSIHIVIIMINIAFNFPCDQTIYSPGKRTSVTNVRDDIKELYVFYYVFNEFGILFRNFSLEYDT